MSPQLGLTLSTNCRHASKPSLTKALLHLSSAEPGVAITKTQHNCVVSLARSELNVALTHGTADASVAWRCSKHLWSAAPRYARILKIQSASCFGSAECCSGLPITPASTKPGTEYAGVDAWRCKFRSRRRCNCVTNTYCWRSSAARPACFPPGDLYRCCTSSLVTANNTSCSSGRTLPSLSLEYAWSVPH